MGVKSFRQAVRIYRKSSHQAVRFAAGFAILAYRCAAAPIRFCFDRSYRSVRFLKWFRNADLHQSTPLTWADRYPEIFSICRDYLGGKPDLNILSYGCATGEEVLTLRHYFPSARITGAEINPHCLAIARKRKPDDRVVLLESDPAAISARGPFDVIFCMAVLQRTPMRIIDKNIRDLTSIYPFGRFDGKLTELDSWLKKDGLLIVHHSQYSLADASVGSSYRPLEQAKHICDKGPKFGRDSLRSETPVTANSIFVKVAGDHGCHLFNNPTAPHSESDVTRPRPFGTANS